MSVTLNLCIEWLLTPIRGFNVEDDIVEDNIAPMCNIWAA
jgi:hypothetical protein